MHEIESFDVAGCTRDDDRPFERGRREHREFGGALLRHAVAHQMAGDEAGPLRECRRGAFDQRRGAVGFVWVARLDADGDDWTAGPEVALEQLFSVVTEETVE